MNYSVLSFCATWFAHQAADSPLTSLDPIWTNFKLSCSTQQAVPSIRFHSILIYVLFAWAVSKTPRAKRLLRAQYSFNLSVGYPKLPLVERAPPSLTKHLCYVNVMGRSPYGLDLGARMPKRWLTMDQLNQRVTLNCEKAENRIDECSHRKRFRHFTN